MPKSAHRYGKANSRFFYLTIPHYKGRSSPGALFLNMRKYHAQKNSFQIGGLRATKARVSNNLALFWELVAHVQLLSTVLARRGLFFIFSIDLCPGYGGANMSVRVGLWRGHFFTLGGSVMTTEHENVYSQSYDAASENAAQGKIREDDITGLHVSYLLLGSALSPELQNLFLTLTH